MIFKCKISMQKLYKFLLPVVLQIWSFITLFIDIM